MKDSALFHVATKLVINEHDRAIKAFPPFNSAHEGYAVILEELDELKAEIWKNQKTRDNERMKTEAIQVAAMALRFIIDICLKDKVRS